MSPVADSDLAAYSERLCGYLQTAQAAGFKPTAREGLRSPLSSPSPLQLQDQPATLEMSSNLRTYFGCLTAALAYLHNQNIRHKDIKPQNILICKGNVLFADFGLSRDFADDIGSTTSGLTPASPRYSAPEVASYEARNTSSNIRSLGCVFLEITAALRGLNVDWMKEYFARSGSHHFHSNHAATVQFNQELKDTAHPTDKRTLYWIEQMLRFDRNARPTAAQVLEIITLSEDDDTGSVANMFCGICCVPDFESDSMDSLADDFDVITAVPQPDLAIQAHFMTNDVSQAASDALLLSSPSKDATAELGSVNVAAYNEPGNPSTASHSEDTPVTETADANYTPPVHSIDESDFRGPPIQAQFRIPRSFDDAEDYNAEPNTTTRADAMVWSIQQSTLSSDTHSTVTATCFLNANSSAAATPKPDALLHPEY
jgi:serine/threonine protein kinase